MKAKYLLLCCLPFLLPACHNMPLSSALSKTTVAEQLTAKQLQTLVNYTWSYQANSNLPAIEASFDGDNVLSIATGCNQQNGTWQAIGESLHTGLLRSTMMMCDPARMAQEKLSQTIFSDSHLRVKFDSNSSEPVLILETQQGMRYTFKGKMKPEAKYQSTGETVFLEVSPTTKPCLKDSSKPCYMVREVTYNAQSVKQVNPTWFTQAIDIEGYQHDPSVRKIIRTKRFKTQTTPSNDVYIYDMTVEQEVITQK